MNDQYQRIVESFKPQFLLGLTATPEQMYGKISMKWMIGYPDDLKLRSSIMLFSEAAPELGVFRKVLDQIYGGKKDGKTLEILKRKQEAVYVVWYIMDQKEGNEIACVFGEEVVYGK